jgi:hypothetical protein
MIRLDFGLKVFIGVCSAFIAAHWFTSISSEPFFNNDETRHVMTGVFFRDFFREMPLTHVREYVTRYYLQYPALGLLVWPPLFYLIEGGFMLIFGASFLASKILIVAFACLALLFAFKLVERTHGIFTAALAVCFMGFSPLFFLFSSQVMLEVPTLAFSLAGIYFFHLYLDDRKSRDIYCASVACALALLTRFDALFIFPTFAGMLISRRRINVLIRKEALVALFVCFIIASPAYIATAMEFGQAHLLAIKSGTGDGASHFMALANFFYYPKIVPLQLGWFLSLLSLCGFCVALLPKARDASKTYLVLLLSTYATFTPMAELEPRHAIYWIPALSLLAAEAVRYFVKGYAPVFKYGITGLCICASAFGSLTAQFGYVHGYRDAAEYVLKHTRNSRYCLFDNFLNGDFIFQMRTLDPERRLSILRGDKLFYAVLSDPHAAYREFAHGNQDILDRIYKYDPEYIVVENPQIVFDMPTASMLRSLLRDSTERFELEKTIPIQSNLKTYEGAALCIYRNKLRNPNPIRLEGLEMIGLGHPIKIEGK